MSAARPVEVIEELIAPHSMPLVMAWNPIMARFRHPQPACIDAHRRFFGCSIAFDQRVDAGGHPRPRRPGDARSAIGNKDVARNVRRIIATLLADGNPTLDRIAERLQMTSRTLQWRLSAEGLSLRTLIDEARHELALRYIARPELSIGEVPFLFGFDQVTSFHRAFRRWTGATPLQFRNREA